MRIMQVVNDEYELKDDLSWHGPDPGLASLLDGISEQRAAEHGPELGHLVDGIFLEALDTFKGTIIKFDRTAGQQDVRY